MPNRTRPLVLLVDDDPDTREMYAWSLEGRGFDVIPAGRASAAAALAAERRPDVVITDFTLPDEDGFVLAARIRASTVLADTPLILVSGRGFVGNSGERAMELFDRVLLKPVLPDQLLADLVPLLLDRSATRLQRQLRAVQSSLRGTPRTSDISRMLTDATDAAMWGDGPAALIADAAARYIGVNDAACTLTGRSREELLSLNVWDLTPAGRVREGREQWVRFVESGELSGIYVLKTRVGDIEARFASSAHVLPGCHLSLLQPVPPALSAIAR